MKSKFYFIFIFLCAPFLIEWTYSTDIADSLFLNQQYREASLEYERNIAFSDDPLRINEAHYKKAQCFKFLNSYGKAQQELSEITYWNLPDSLNKKYRYESILCSYLAGSFNDALLQIEQYERTDSSSTQAMAFLIKSFCYNELEQWSQAHEAAKKYILLTCEKTKADSINHVLVKLYSKKNLPKMKKEKKANVLRMFPGLGQAYAGAPMEGAVNFTLNLAFLSFGVYQIIEGFYITGYFVGAIGLNKVYFGGHARTKFLIGRNNYKRKQHFCISVKNVLIETNASSF